MITAAIQNFRFDMWSPENIAKRECEIASNLAKQNLSKKELEKKILFCAEPLARPTDSRRKELIFESAKRIRSLIESSK
jgi:hypothetical protein